jgi:hypothetical protein
LNGFFITTQSATTIVLGRESLQSSRYHHTKGTEKKTMGRSIYGLLNLTDFRSYRPGFDHNALYKTIFSFTPLVLHDKKTFCIKEFSGISRISPLLAKLASLLPYTEI